MTTKERILQASLELFNTNGVSKTTVRDVAKKVGISHGNLCYHYRTINDIVLALHTQLAQSINHTLDALQPDANIFRSHTDAIGVIFKLSYQYRFFFLHFIEICQRLPIIKKRHAQSIRNRKKQVRYFFARLREQRLFRGDLPAHQYESLIDHCFLFGDFWISSSQILYRGAAAKKVGTYVKEYLALFYPYLTPKGMRLVEEVGIGH